MTDITIFSQQADLALAAYANLRQNMVDDEYIATLGFAGMSKSQATEFVKHWTVVDSVNFSLNGASATVFENKETGVRYLVVRGTDPNLSGSIDALLADLPILAGIPSFLNPQFLSLQGQVRSWIDSGVLPPDFSATGHSLGGYLAAAITSWNGSGTAYMYNSPGISSAIGNLYDVLKAVLGMENVPLVNNVYNFRSNEGISITATLGAQLAPPTYVQIEPSVGTGNHSMLRLTDSLAVAALFSELDPSLSVQGFIPLFQAASADASASLESLVNALGRLLLGDATAQVGTGNREDFYTVITNIQVALQSLQEEGVGFTLTQIAGGSSMASMARQNNADGMAYRYALIDGGAGNDWIAINSKAANACHISARGRFYAIKLAVNEATWMLAA